MTELEVYDHPHEGKDYNIKLTIRNGPLMRAIRMRGYKSVSAFAKDVGLHASALYCYFNLRRAPIYKSGRWSETVLRMAKVLRLPPDSLFPLQHLEQALEHNSGELEVSKEELSLLLELPGPSDPEQLMIEADKLRVLDKMVATLPQRTQDILRMRFGLDGGEEMTLQQVADHYGLSRDRIRQIEATGLRKLKHPSRSRPLFNAGWQFHDFRFDDNYAFIEKQRALHEPPKPQQFFNDENADPMFAGIGTPPRGHVRYGGSGCYYINAREEIEFWSYVHKYGLRELGRGKGLICYEVGPGMPGYVERHA